jgi:hypothetical protein
MLTTKSYVPILKWKRAEQGALKELSEERKKLVQPLIEIVPPKQDDKKSDDEANAEMIANFTNVRTKDIPKEILQAWGEDPIFIDLTPIYPPTLKQTGVREIIRNCIKLRLKPIPVMNLFDVPAYQLSVSTASQVAGYGICLRITLADLKNIENTNNHIEEILHGLGLDPANIDLLVDVKEVNDELTYRQSVLNSQKLARLNEWRSFIFANGTFPQDMTEQSKEDLNEVPRREWINWKRQQESEGVLRKPVFADYAIRYPIYNEAVMNFPGTASLKYTHKDEWLIMKGDVRRFDQYLAHAQILVGMEQFYGQDFSVGDTYIKEKADYRLEYERLRLSDPTKAKGTGRAEDWIRAGINHHLSVVVDQLANQA